MLTLGGQFFTLTWHGRAPAPQAWTAGSSPAVTAWWQGPAAGSKDAARRVVVAGGRWGSYAWVPPYAWGHALTLLLTFLFAEGAEPAAPRKSVSPRAGSPGSWDGVSLGGTCLGTWHQHHGGQRGQAADGTGACAQIQDGIIVFSDIGGT